MPWFVRLPDIQQPDKNEKFTLKAALTAGARGPKNKNAEKATQIFVGVDVHLRGLSSTR
jgi:hypothetical protein